MATTPHAQWSKVVNACVCWLYFPQVKSIRQFEYFAMDVGRRVVRCRFSSINVDVWMTELGRLLLLAIPIHPICTTIRTSSLARQMVTLRLIRSPIPSCKRHSSFMHKSSSIRRHCLYERDSNSLLGARTDPSHFFPVYIRLCGGLSWKRSQIRDRWSKIGWSVFLFFAYSVSSFDQLEV